MKRLAIIIVTHNSEKHIFDCVKSIKEYSDLQYEEIELIVVDNQSRNPQPMFDRLHQLWGDDIITVLNNRNGGYGQGNNVGIRKATAPVIMIMNPDVRLREPVFRHCLQQFDQDEKLVLYGLTQRKGNGRLGRSTSWVNDIHPYIAEPLRFLTGKLNLFFPKYMYVTGACFLLRKKSFEKIGMFDETIFMYGEEEDIHNRLLADGTTTRMGYSRRLSYTHLHQEEATFSDNSHQWMEQHLNTLFKINQRNGIPNEKTIAWAIKRNNFSIWKESLKCLLSRGKNRSRIDYYRSWKRTLQQKLTSL